VIFIVRVCTPEDAEETARLLAGPLVHAEPIPQVPEEETADLIFAMAKNKAPGDDSINAIALKLLAPNSKKLVTLTFNKCLPMGHFPSPWKRGRVVMIPTPKKISSSVCPYLGVNVFNVRVPLVTNLIFFYLKSGNVLNITFLLQLIENC